ncbi:3-keto-5-aminohexanoate cleavage protein [Amorphus sp. 3PC139-8]|uniref:3-keto-5-aminohexanoate cleavage protein n=1 Tax=Amorphus sp. 3PC139-8 TaxID=2735676 RepID=UPI00345DFBDB
MADGSIPPVAIAVAPNGGRRTTADHPEIPLTPAALAATARACLDAGAAMIHVHVRDQAGEHLLDADAYRAAISAIRAEVGDALVLQITTEALGKYQPADQIALVRALKPEAASLALREIAPGADDVPAFADLLGFMREERIAPQIILYTPEEAERLAGLIREGEIPATDLPIIFPLGRYTAGQRSEPADLLPFLAPGRPRFDHWMVCAFGPREAACVATGALLGGHIRVGFENNLQLPDGRTAPDNAALVATAANLVRAAGLTTASATDLRRAWRID